MANKHHAGGDSPGNIARGTTAELDPPESGPPTAEELGLADAPGSQVPDLPAAAIGAVAPAGTPVAAKRKPGRPKKLKAKELGEPAAGNGSLVPDPGPNPVPDPGPDLAAAPGDGAASRPDAGLVAIMAGMDQVLAAVWPQAEITVDWIFVADPDPHTGDVVGWNWVAGEIAVVTKHPRIDFTKTWTVTIALEKMPKAWRNYKAFNLTTGDELRLAWYTAWNRRFVCAKDAPYAVPRGGWLAVIQEETARE
jgi:hypothetical protein